MLLIGHDDVFHITRLSWKAHIQYSLGFDIHVLVWHYYYSFEKVSPFCTFVSRNRYGFFFTAKINFISLYFNSHWLLFLYLCIYISPIKYTFSIYFGIPDERSFHLQYRQKVWRDVTFQEETCSREQAQSASCWSLPLPSDGCSGQQQVGENGKIYTSNHGGMTGGGGGCCPFENVEISHILGYFTSYWLKEVPYL